MAYDYTDEAMVASCLVEPKDIDSFYNPTTQNHTGFAWDGTHYTSGVQDAGPVYASWFSESAGSFRGLLQNFPQNGLALLTKVSLIILDSSTLDLALWMQFLMENTYALTNDFNGAMNGWRPSALAYADGILSVIHTPDDGNEVGSFSSTYNIDSNMVVNIDFSQDKVYLDVALNPNSGPPIIPPTYIQTQHNSLPEGQGATFNGVHSNPINLWGAASSTDSFTNWTVSQTDATLFITFYDGAMAQLEDVDLSTLSFSTTVTPPTGTAYYTINAVNPQATGIYQADFERNSGVVQYAATSIHEGFTTAFNAALATSGPTTENVYPIGVAKAGDTFTVSGTPSAHLNLIFYDGGYGLLSSLALNSGGPFVAPAGTIFWGVLLQGASASGNYNATYVVTLA